AAIGIASAGITGHIQFVLLWVAPLGSVCALRPIWQIPSEIGRRALFCCGLGRSQVVRQRILIPPYGGSNPPAPAKSRLTFQLLETKGRLWAVFSCRNPSRSFAAVFLGSRHSRDPSR